MLFVLTILSLIFYLLILRKGRSAQNFFLISLLYSYQLILLLSVYLSIPLDIFEDSDDPRLRFEMARLNLWFFFAIYLGQHLEAKVGALFTTKQKILQQGIFVQILFLVLSGIVVAQFFVMPPRIFSGEYSNEKPGYYFEYFTIFFCLHFVKGEPKKWLQLAPFILFCSISILAGERLMLITAVSAYLYFNKPFSINLKSFAMLAVALILILQIDNLRSGSEGGSLIGSFIFSDEVTHHGSLLYSSLVLLEYANNTPVSLHSLSNSFSFLFGFDESTQGLGLAAEIASFGRRGGGGLLPSYLSVLFGSFFGPIATACVGLMLGVLIQAHSLGKKIGFISLVFLSFAAHFVIYTPVLILKPVFFASVIALAWSLATELQTVHSRKNCTIE